MSRPTTASTEDRLRGALWALGHERQLVTSAGYRKLQQAKALGGSFS